MTTRVRNSFLDARRHVNKMCIASGVPLVESGTAGYLGQVQPLVKVRGVWYRPVKHSLELKFFLELVQGPDRMF